MRKLQLCPTSAGYASQHADETISIQLDGGASRFRLDKIGAVHMVNAQWVLNGEEYHYFNAFHRVVTASGSDPFLIDIITYRETKVEHTAHFVPGSVSLTQQTGGIYYVSAQLEVLPLPIVEEDELDFVALFEEFGSPVVPQFLAVEDMLNTIVNVDLPESMPG